MKKFFSKFSKQAPSPPPLYEGFWKGVILSETQQLHFFQLVREKNWVRTTFQTPSGENLQYKISCYGGLSACDPPNREPPQSIT